MRVFTRNIDNEKHQPVMNELVLEVESKIDKTMFDLMTSEFLAPGMRLILSAFTNLADKQQIAFRVENGQDIRK